MARRKRVRSVRELNDLLMEQGQLYSTQGLRKTEYQSDIGYQDDALPLVPSEVTQPLGRMPGRGMSPDEEHLMYSVTEAFDEGILNKLSQRQRECFTDVIISGDTYEAVAVRHNITKSAVQVYVKRAALQIRKYIEARDGI